jgi:ABC-2 type transport system permease protein
MVMMLFTAAMRVTREVESGGLKRLQMTRVSPLEYLAGVSAVQVLVGTTAVGLTFVIAVILGFHSRGPLWLALLVGILSASSVIGVGLIVAAFARSTTEALIIANLPMVLMMFFSGGVFPIARVPLFTIFGRSVALFDILPQTYAVLALNKVLTLGANLTEITFELVMVLFLSLIYFAFGVAIFGKRVMKEQLR